mgnify:CR=1 FL=1
MLLMDGKQFKSKLQADKLAFFNVLQVAIKLTSSEPQSQVMVDVSAPSAPAEHHPVPQVQKVL